MTRALAYANGAWEEVSGDPTVGPGREQAAPGNHDHYEARKAYARRAQDQFLGGGEIRWGIQNNLYWSERFICITTGQDPYTAVNGHYSIDMQTSGAITVVGGAPARNWQTYGIVLNTFETLWYILPFGSTNATLPGNYRLSGTSADFTPGPDWVIVATTDNEGIRICNGMRLSRYGNSTISPDTGWRAPTLLNGWVNYGDIWEPAGYRRMNGMVYLRGLIRAGTVQWNIPIFNLPYGFRPATDQHNPGAAYGQFAPLNISANGDVGQNSGSNGWLSLETSPFPAAV